MPILLFLYYKIAIKLLGSNSGCYTCDLKYVQNRGGKKYFVTFIDDCKRYCYVYLLRSKDEALEKFMHYKNEVENKLCKKIKAIKSDRGGEYDAHFDRFYQEHGIIHQTSGPYTP